MIDLERQTSCYILIEKLLSNGHTYHTLPISKERAAGIVVLKEEATEQDLRLLEDEWNKVNGKTGG